MPKATRTISVALISFFGGLASAIFFLPLWIRPVVKAIEGSKPEDWIGFIGNIAGNLVTGIVAAVAIYAAWRASSSQMRISLASREEDRIEASLPSLLAAIDFCDSITKQIRIETDIFRITDRLRHVGLRNEASVPPLVSSVAAGIPDHLKRRMIASLTRLIRRAASAASARVDLTEHIDLAELDSTEIDPRHREEFERLMGLVEDCLEAIEEVGRLLKQEMRESNRLLPRLRAEIRSHIG